jgi:hypothetical protein
MSACLWVAIRRPLGDAVKGTLSGLGDTAEGRDDGSLEQDSNAALIAGAEGVFSTGAHRIVCGDATDL